MDLQKLPSSSREAEASRIIIEEARYSFNLTHGPLLRLTLLRLTKEDHILLLTAHQIICDGWSVDVFFRELETMYRSFSTESRFCFPIFPSSSRTLRLATAVVPRRGSRVQLSYWKKQLGGTLPVLELPTDRPRPTTQSFRGARKA